MSLVENLWSAEDEAACIAYLAEEEERLMVSFYVHAYFKLVRTPPPRLLACLPAFLPT